MKQLISTQTLDHLPEDLIWLYQKVADKSNNRRNKNYILEDAFADYTLCYTLSTVNGVPYLGSVAWNRPMYNGMIRVATRYCVNPDYAYFNIKFKDGIRQDAITHIHQQVEFTKKLGYNDHFISREDNTPNAKNTKRILKKLNANSPYKWKMSTEKQRVAPNPITGWQWIIYNNKEYINKDL